MPGCNSRSRRTLAFLRVTSFWLRVVNSMKHAVVGKVEVGTEGEAGSAVGVPFEDELDRLVLPAHTVEIEELGEVHAPSRGRREPSLDAGATSEASTVSPGPPGRPR